jgi:hypothetical protein
MNDEPCLSAVMVLEGEDVRPPGQQAGPSAGRGEVSFSVEGDYFEVCNCDVSCNCVWLGPTHPGPLRYLRRESAPGGSLELACQDRLEARNGRR